MYGTDARLLDIVAGARPIDHSNTSAGIHMYWHDRDDPQWTHMACLREHYPAINTEFSVSEKKGKVDAKKAWAYSEEVGLAWIDLDQRQTPTGRGNYGDGVLNTCHWSFTWPIPPHGPA